MTEYRHERRPRFRDWSRFLSPDAKRDRFAAPRKLSNRPATWRRRRVAADIVAAANRQLTIGADARAPASRDRTKYRWAHGCRRSPRLATYPSRPRPRRTPSSQRPPGSRFPAGWTEPAKIVEPSTIWSVHQVDVTDACPVTSRRQSHWNAFGSRIRIPRFEWNSRRREKNRRPSVRRLA